MWCNYSKTELISQANARSWRSGAEICGSGYVCSAIMPHLHSTNPNSGLTIQNKFDCRQFWTCASSSLHMVAETQHSLSGDSQSIQTDYMIGSPRHQNFISQSWLRVPGSCASPTVSSGSQNEKWRGDIFASVFLFMRRVGWGKDMAYFSTYNHANCNSDTAQSLDFRSLRCLWDCCNKSGLHSVIIISNTILFQN